MIHAPDPRALALRCTLALALAGCADDVPYKPFFSERSASDSLPRVVQPTLFGGCRGPSQPAVVDFVGPQRTPAWACLQECPEGSQHVTDVELVTAMADGRPVSRLDPTCVPVCPEGEHRRAFFDFGKQAHCAPGEDPDPVQRRAIAAERAHMTEQRASESADRLRVADDRLTDIEAILHTLDAAKVPWNLDQIEDYGELPGRLARAAGSPLASRLASARVGADALAQRAEESKRAVGYLKVRERPTTRETRHQACVDACDAPAASCLRDCATLPAGACDACRERAASCRAVCERAATR